MIEDEKAMPAPRRRRLYISVNGYAVQRILMILVTGSGLVGLILGDIWLWRLIYG